MLRYSMSNLGREAGRAKGTTALLPPVEGRLSTEREYYAALRGMLTAVAKETRETIIPAYEAERGQRRATAALRMDADQSWFSRLNALVVGLTRVATNTVTDILDLEAIRHTDTFIEVARRTLGIDIRSVVRQEDLSDYLRTAAARNASLIKSLADDVVKRVEQTVYENSIAGNSVKTLRARLKEQFDISDRRARLIARDQSSKLTSDLNRIRQEQAGVTSYKWMTSRDERVRERHRTLEGKVYKWGEPTGAENGLPPGQPINCRCVARGVVEF